MCLSVLTEIPEELTFTPFALSLGCGETLEGVGGWSTHDFFVSSMVLEITLAA